MARKRTNSTNLDQDSEEPKRKLRPSAAISKSGLTPKQIRTTTLQLNLDKYPLTEAVSQEVERLAILGGRWRHLVGLFSNFLACQNLQETVIEDGPDASRLPGTILLVTGVATQPAFMQYAKTQIKTAFGVDKDPAHTPPMKM